MKLIFAALLLAAPLSGQEPVSQILLGTSSPTVEIRADSLVAAAIGRLTDAILSQRAEPRSDSLVAAAIDRAHVDLVAAWREECGCDGGTSTVVRVGQAGVLILLGYIGAQLKGIKDNQVREQESGPAPEEEPESYGESGKRH